jgi:redox-sensitive bicupin YhaK (pirin superfamily)
MIDIRKFDSLGHADHGWLDARHHFSFANYHDPKRMGWGRIRVRTGAITHQDSMGNKGRTGAGDVQVMSAGTGVTHAEFNLEDEDTTLFQIWIETDKPGAQPGWGAMPFPKESRKGQFQLLASGNGDDGVLHINSDARILGATLKAGETLEYAADPSRHLYLVPSAKVEVNGTSAEKRDGVAITGEAVITVKAEEDAELVLVDAR